jgi:hypothetical protein
MSLIKHRDTVFRKYPDSLLSPTQGNIHLVALQYGVAAYDVYSDLYRSASVVEPTGV